MNNKLIIFVLVLLLVGGVWFLQSDKETTTRTMTAAVAPFDSVSVLAFGPDNVLFVGDSANAQIVALALGEAEAATESTSYNLENIEDRLAEHFGVDRSELRVNDVKVHPQTKEAYIAVTLGFAQEKTAHLVTVTTSGTITELDYDSFETTQAAITDSVDESVVFWGKVPARALAITDIDYHNGMLYVAGLSNEEFSSTLRKVPYPFDGNHETTQIEMYHTTHNQMETRAPIRTQVIRELNGEDHVIAGYTCTPVVTVPLDSLADGELVSGKTIAEIGYGNAPIDVLSFTTSVMSEEGGEPITQDVVLVTNTHRGAALFNVDDIEAMNRGTGMTEPAGFNPGGAAYQPLPLAGLLHVDEQDEQFILGLRRNIETGNLDLVSFRKGLYFRLSDFVNEYDFPSYQYPPEQEPLRGLQNMLITDEGLTEYLHQ